jgi:hypothetical protein
MKPEFRRNRTNRPGILPVRLDRQGLMLRFIPLLGNSSGAGSPATSRNPFKISQLTQSTLKGDQR